jgi:hypothetical protein
MPHSMEFQTLTLDRMKIRAAAMLSPSVLASLEMRHVFEDMTDRMIYSLQAEVLAERVLDTDASVEFTGSRRVVTDVRVRGLLLPFAVAGVLCCVGLIVSSVPLVVGSMMVALLAVLLLSLNPGATVDVTVPVDGTVTVPATYWRRFPEATVAYPPELRGPVRFAIMNPPTYTAYAERESDR